MTPRKDGDLTFKTKQMKNNPLEIQAYITLGVFALNGLYSGIKFLWSLRGLLSKKYLESLEL